MRIGFDIETTGLTPWHSEHEMLSYAWDTASGGSGACTADRSECQGRQAGGFHDAELAVHNGISFDFPWWVFREGPLPQRWFDTQVALALIDENAPNSLDAASRAWLGEEKIDPGDKTRLAELPTEELLEYNRKDAELHRRLADAVEPELERQDLRRVFDFYMDAGRVLVDMMVTGVAFDTAQAGRLLGTIPQRAERIDGRLQDAVSALVEEPVNWNSPQQVSGLLFDTMGMPENFLDDPMIGPRSTSKYVLEALRLAADDMEVKQLLGDLLDYRRLSKLVGTYLDPLTNKHLGRDGRIHTFYHVLRSQVGKRWRGTATGRLSSSQPNLQNQANDPDLLSCFTATPGMLLGTWDYRQLELILAAWYAQERELLDAFSAGRDLHSAVLAGMSGLPYEEVVRRAGSDPVWKQKRRYTKNVHFTILYQGTKYAVRRQARMAGQHLSWDAAQGMLDDWYARYPRVRARIDAWIDEVSHAGELIDPTGMRRRVPDALEGGRKAQRAQRQAISAMVQGFAGKIMLAGLLALEERLADFPGARPVMTVHDSVVVEYPAEYRETLPPVVREALTQGARDVMVSRFDVGQDLPLDVDEELGLERLAEPRED